MWRFDMNDIKRILTVRLILKMNKCLNVEMFDHSKFFKCPKFVFKRLGMKFVVDSLWPKD